MRNNVLTGITTLLVVAFLTSCGKVPQKKIDSVLSIIDSAKDMESDIYLSSEFTAIQNSLNAVMHEVDLQKPKLVKDFKLIDKQLDSIQIKTTQLITNTVVKKEQIKKQADSLIAALKIVVDNNAKLIVKAKKDKKGKMVVEKLKDEINSMNASFAESLSLFKKENYMDVIDKINDVKKNAEIIYAKLSEPKSKNVTKKKSKK